MVKERKSEYLYRFLAFFYITSLILTLTVLRDSWPVMNLLTGPNVSLNLLVCPESLRFPALFINKLVSYIQYLANNFKLQYDYIRKMLKRNQKSRSNETERKFVGMCN